MIFNIYKNLLYSTSSAPPEAVPLIPSFTLGFIPLKLGIAPDSPPSCLYISWIIGLNIPSISLIFDSYLSLDKVGLSFTHFKTLSIFSFIIRLTW